MSTTKALLASRTFWGAVVAGLSGLLSLWGRDIAPADQAELVETAATLAAMAGSIVAVWGRVTASKRIGGLVSGGER